MASGWRLVDSTLREGDQTAGLSFSLEQKVELAAGLVRLGIEEIEVGVANLLAPELTELVRRCRAQAQVARLALWCRCVPEDIAFAATLAPEVLSLSIPLSDLHIATKLGKNRPWVLARIAQSIGLARNGGLNYVSIGFEDATRADPKFVLRAAQVAERAGADRVRLADTVGIATPASIGNLLKIVREKVSLELGVHMHNDFGMATANAVAAFEAGADWADVTLLGLGERAGNSRLEEVAGFLALRQGRGYRLETLRPLTSLVAKMAKKEIDPQHPLVGERIFACETGLHLLGLARDHRTYEPYDPALVGASRQAIYGGKIGRGGVRLRLEQLGLQCSGQNLSGLTDRFRRQCLALGRPLVDHEVRRMVEEYSS
ncbi:MAG: pyruvate carboxyltransferase [Desulfobulbaceae bacterium]|nr:pyruvate carboxyltransferase [Desulfobulbaceae bacterium]HIJ79531.1 pyruvate carboxyltransferase [Deltaproteobacteria bacterium]